LFLTHTRVSLDLKVITQVSTQSSMKNRSRNLDGQTQAKHTGILKDRKIRDLFFKRIRFNLLKGWISPQPAGLLFHHQSTIENF